MSRQKFSLLITLGIIIVFTVTAIMSMNATYNYLQTKNKIIQDIKDNSRTTVTSLKSNITNLMAAYAVNEYDNLVQNEIARRDIFAIVVEDYNMGRILGEKSFTSGKIRQNKYSIINYNPENLKHQNELTSCFFSETSNIITNDGKKLGSISIYINDDKINEELNKIIKDTLINTIAISVLLTILLFFTIRQVVLKPISKIIDAIHNSDKDGIPISLIPDSKTKEISTLSNSMNNMITTIKESRLILTQSENRLKYLLEMSPIAVRIARNEGKEVFFANRAYLELLRIDQSKTINNNPQDYYTDKVVYDEIIESLKTKKQIYNKLVELKIEGKTVWALASYMIIEFDHEEAVLGWFYDVTSEKENEAKLYEALDLQTRIFDNSGYMIIRTDKNGLIQQINKEAEEILGYKEEELVNKHTPKIIHLESECIQRAQEFSQELKMKIEPNFDLFVCKSNLGLDNEHEWTYVSKDGINIPVLLSVSELRDKNNEVYGYLGISKDLTQRKLIESQSKLASMGEMIGNIAHQWRQPLSVISTISSGVKFKSEFGGLEDNELKQDMDVISKQAQYLSNTIDDFRNFIKNTNKKERISLCTTVKKALSILHPSMVSNDIEIVSKLECDLEVEAYENQLIQAILNIVNNAKDALKENNENKEKYIFINTKANEDELTITIRDNAGGIPKEIINKVFEPYFTTKHQSIGTGIGLSMTYQIITEHHNATIKVSNEKFEYENAPQIGASFQIIFSK